MTISLFGITLFGVMLISEEPTTDQNVLLQGERRIGKTSLIFETTRRVRSCKTLLIHTMEIKTAHDFCQRIIRAYIYLESNSNLLSKILKYFASLQPRLGVDSITGLPVVTLDQSVQLKPDALEGILDLIASIQRKKSSSLGNERFRMRPWTGYLT